MKSWAITNIVKKKLLKWMTFSSNLNAVWIAKIRTTATEIKIPILKRIIEPLKYLKSKYPIRNVKTWLWSACLEKIRLAKLISF